MMYPSLTSKQLNDLGLKGKERTDVRNDRLKLQNDARTTLLQGLAGLAVLGGAYFTFRQVQHGRQQLAHTIESSREQQDLAREGQVTERFTKAVDQLGNESLAVKLGGIYALQRIARDSEDDRFTISEVLCAYVRTAKRDAFNGEDRRPDTLLDMRAADVQAALTILADWQDRVGAGDHSLDLHGADLQGARLEGANLRGAKLYDAQLQKAHLHQADLQGALLDRAKLQRAELHGTNLQGARLWDAKLKGATADQSTVWPDGVWADRQYRKDVEGIKEDGEGATKEKPGFWTRWKAFAQVKLGRISRYFRTL
jgi:Pentapeptide repeats (8 copies)